MENTTIKEIGIIIGFIVLIAVAMFQGKIIITTMENKTAEYCNELIENKTIETIDQCNLTSLKELYTTEYKDMFAGGKTK